MGFYGLIENSKGSDADYIVIENKKVNSAMRNSG